MKAKVIYTIEKEIEIEYDDFSNIVQRLKEHDWINEGKIIGNHPSIIGCEIIDFTWIKTVDDEQLIFMINKKHQVTIVSEIKTREQWFDIYQKVMVEIKNRNPDFDSDKVTYFAKQMMPEMPKDGAQL